MRRTPVTIHQGGHPLTKRHGAAALLALAAAALAALASNLARAEPYGASPGYGPDTITFATWCGEINHYDAARCKRRDPADLQAFRTSLDRMQGFEVEKQKEVRKDREFRQRFDSMGTSEPWRTDGGPGYSSN